jgi:5'-3' exoribonuclease 1
MGIPSYFSYIIRNHANIARRFGNSMNVHNLYLDSNSIVYDAARLLRLEDFKSMTDFETALISSVCSKIEEYVLLVKPSQCVFVAFDGVPPMAKMQQQRLRRYKGQVTTILTRDLISERPPSWNTVAITPGTPFMEKLDKGLIHHFRNAGEKYAVDFIVSPSGEAGEGEHKIFDFMRRRPDFHADSTTVIYGLDADLIILGLNHLSHCPSIFLLREAPSFIGSINSDFVADENYLLELSLLAEAIIHRMTGGSVMPHTDKMYDYILMTAMLGNDFMPHFPSVNIRTSGIDILLDTYGVVVKDDEVIFNGEMIDWPLFKKFVKALGAEEHRNLLREYKVRDKYRVRHHKCTTSSELEEKLNAIPMARRDEEHYICPTEECWEDRYYKTLFRTDPTPHAISTICTNYLESIEWNMKYYTIGCPDWNTCYHYDYPPLLVDLSAHVPDHNISFVEIKAPEPLTKLQLLAYVLPKSHLQLLPYRIYEKLKDKEWYSNNFPFKWAFCKYFWEGHVLFPDIDLKELKKICV